MLDDNFKQHCKEVQGKAKLVKGKKTLMFKKNLHKKRGKSDNGENLDFSCSVIKVEESANSANTINVQSISKSDSSTKS